MANVKEAKLKDLIQDDRNLNAGTERGQQLIEKSLREFGAGRSILLDKNNRIIAGNKTHANAELAGRTRIERIERIRNYGNYDRNGGTLPMPTTATETMVEAFFQILEGTLLHYVLELPSEETPDIWLLH